MKLIELPIGKKIISTVANDDYFSSPFDAWHFEGFDGRKRYAFIAECKLVPSAHLVVSVPTVTSNIYVTITEGNPALVRQVLANLEDMEPIGPVAIGNVALFEHPELRAHSICGVILLPGSIFNMLDHLPENILFQEAEYPFMGVIFITDSEHEIWKTDGYDSLMEYYTKIDKDLICFGVDPAVSDSP